MGVIEAIFHALGKTLSAIDLLKIMETGAVSETAQFLMNSGESRSGPAPFEPSNPCILDNTSSREKLKSGTLKTCRGKLFKYASDEGDRLLLSTLRKKDENKFAESNEVSASTSL